MHFPTLARLKMFLNYLETLDVSYYAAINRSKGLAKDIFLPIGDTSVNMAFSVAELEELKQVIHDYLEKLPTVEKFAVHGDVQAFCLN
jgi:hypothetical protein